MRIRATTFNESKCTYVRVFRFLYINRLLYIASRYKLIATDSSRQLLFVCWGVSDRYGNLHRCVIFCLLNDQFSKGWHFPVFIRTLPTHHDQIPVPDWFKFSWLHFQCTFSESAVCTWSQRTDLGNNTWTRGFEGGFRGLFIDVSLKAMCWYHHSCFYTRSRDAVVTR